jgi:type II secretory pathway pseudopilin PulG
MAMFRRIGIRAAVLAGVQAGGAAHDAQIADQRRHDVISTLATVAHIRRQLHIRQVLPRYPASRALRRRRGFTLIEAALTTMIVGLAFVAVLQLIASGTVSNVQAAETTTAVNLAKCLREMTLGKEFTQVLAMNGSSHQPPVDADGASMEEFGEWKQTLAVRAVDAQHLVGEVNDDDPSAVRLTATVEHNGEKVCDLSWYAFKGPAPAP